MLNNQSTKEENVKEVYAVIQKNGSKKKPFWQKVGVAFDNSDGSLNVLLNCIPLDGRLHIREAKKKDKNENQSDK